MPLHGRAGTSPDDWHSSVFTSISSAGNTHSQADALLSSSMQAIRMSNSEHNRHRDAVNGHLSQKVENTKELVSQLSTRIRSIKTTIDHSQWSMQNLQHAQKLLEEPVEICRMRKAWRLKRPKKEQVPDAFQEALHEEERTLEREKYNMNDAITDTQKLIRALTSDLDQLEADLKDKQHAMQIDSLCKDKIKAVEHGNAKLDKSYTGGPVPLKEVLPEILGTPRKLDTGGRVNERQRQKGTLISIERALRLEDQAKQRWQATTALVDHSKSITSNAIKRTQMEMGSKIADTEILRQELTKQLKRTEQKIVEANKILGLTTGKLAQLEKPTTGNAERQRIRGTRTPREAIADEVSEALSLQQSGLQEQKISLGRQVSNIHAALEELESTKRQLMEEIANKEKALEIDRACAAAKNTAHGHYSYGHSKVGDGQRIFSDTSSSMKRRIMGSSHGGASVCGASSIFG